MKKYNISNKIHQKKIFIVNFSGLQERIDAQFYAEVSDFSSFQRLSKIAFVRGGKRIPLGETYSRIKTSYLYLRVVNISDNNTIDFNTLFCIDELVFEILKKYEIQRNDLVISIAGTIGKVVFLQNIPMDKKIILTENCAKITLKTDLILPQFLELVLNLPIVQKQIALNYVQTTIPKLSLDRIKNLRLPKFPNKDEQYKIVKFYKGVYRKKQQKDIRAVSLLASIDDFLLNQLGIVLPPKNNSLKNRVFLASFREVSGDMFDPFLLKNKSQKIEGRIFPNKELTTVAKIYKGQNITKERVTGGNYPVIAGGQVSPYNHNTYNEEGNCITVSASGAYSGYVWYHKDPIFASDCIVIKSFDEQIVKTIFIYEILRLKQPEIYLLQKGAGQPHVYPDDLAKLNIPLLSIKRQEKIVGYIQKIRIQAQQLQQEGVNILEQTKKQVERMILR
jgi:restriction endonuclease S subunit